MAFPAAAAAVPRGVFPAAAARRTREILLGARIQTYIDSRESVLFHDDRQIPRGKEIG